MEQSSLDLSTQMQAILTQIETMEQSNYKLKQKVAELKAQKKQQVNEIGKLKENNNQKNEQIARLDHDNSQLKEII